MDPLENAENFVKKELERSRESGDNVEDQISTGLLNVQDATKNAKLDLDAYKTQENQEVNENTKFDNLKRIQCGHIGGTYDAYGDGENFGTQEKQEAQEEIGGPKWIQDAQKNVQKEQIDSSKTDSQSSFLDEQKERYVFSKAQQGIVNRMKNAFESPQVSVNERNGQQKEQRREILSPQVSVHERAEQFEQHKERRRGSRVSTNSSGSRHEHFEAEIIEEEARCLKEQALCSLEQIEEEFQRAQIAQEDAARAAELANQITLMALNKEVECQEKLVAAGHKLMEAGALLQTEAASIGHKRQTIINVHQKGQIRQQTEAVSQPLPPPAELRVHQARQVLECRPVVEERLMIAKFDASGPQMSY